MNHRIVKLNIPNTDQYRIVVIPTQGDGSCFFHAICDAFYKSYRSQSLNGNYTSRSDIVTKLRTEISNMLDSVDPNDERGRTYYYTASGGDLPSFAEADPVFSLENLKRHIDSKEPVGEEVVSIVGKMLDKSIYIIDSSTMSVYSRGGIPEELPSVVIIYNGSHYELVGIMEYNGIITTHFAHTHPFIATIRKKMISLKK